MRIDAGKTTARSIPLTSLIDVIFLLLLFFMLSTSFARFVHLDMSSASKTGTSTDENPPIVITIDGEKGLFVNDVPVEIRELTARLDTHAEEGAKRAVALIQGEVSVQSLTRVLDGGRRSKLDAIVVLE